MINALFNGLGTGQMFDQLDSQKDWEVSRFTLVVSTGLRPVIAWHMVYNIVAIQGPTLRHFESKYNVAAISRVVLGAVTPFSPRNAHLPHRQEMYILARYIRYGDCGGGSL